MSTLLISAVEAEMAPLMSSPDCQIQNSFTAGRRSVKQIAIGETELLAMATGPGAVNTAMALAAILENHPVHRIIQIGCAGGFALAGVKVGDVAIATEEIDVQLGLELETDEKSSAIGALPFAVMEKEERQYKHRYLMNRDWAEDAAHAIHDSGILSQKEISLFKGSFVSASTITTTTQRANELFDLYCPVMESMEGAAAAHTAIHYGVPHLQIRSASNLVGPRNRDQWDLSLAFENSCKALMAILKQTT